MARDYGKRRQSKQRSSAPKQFFGVVASFLLGYLTANVFDFTSLNNWVHKNILANDEPQPAAKVVAKPEDHPKPKFEFYTLLAKDHSPPVALPRPTLATPAKPAIPPQGPNAATQQVAAVTNATTTNVPHTSVPAPVTSSKPVTSVKPVALAQNKPSKETYLVQIASFKSPQEAQKMKATLTLKGFDVSIVAAPPQQGGWFRVVLGPYHSKMEAEKIKVAVARTERINGMVRKLDA